MPSTGGALLTTTLNLPHDSVERLMERLTGILADCFIYLTAYLLGVFVWLCMANAT